MARTPINGSAQAIAGDAIPLLAANAEVQPFDDGGVILDTITGQLFSCNHVTMTYLSLVDGVSSIDTLAKAVAEHYSVPAGDVVADLIEISGELANEKLLTLR